MAVMIGTPGGGPPKDGEEPDHDEGEFQAPEGIDLEGKKPGEMIEVVATLEVKEGGKLCVRKVNGVDVPGYEDKPEEEPAPDEENFTSAAMGKEEEAPTGEEA